MTNQNLTPKTSEVLEAQQPVSDPVTTFYAELARLEPHTYVSTFLIAVNILFFVGMLVNILVSSGALEFGNIFNALMNMDPTVAEKWGSNYALKTTDGDWWRLITSMFIHFGLLHVVFNMSVLVTSGPLIERSYGRCNFILLYFASGVGGALASIFWDPSVNSAGASGAIFGLVGAEISFAIMVKIPKSILWNSLKSSLLFIIYNIYLGAISPNTDNAAHLGGIITGFILGVILARTNEQRKLNKVSLVRVLLALILATACFVPAGLVDVQRSIPFKLNAAFVDFYNNSLNVRHNVWHEKVIKFLDQGTKQEIDNTTAISVVKTVLIPELQKIKELLNAQELPANSKNALVKAKRLDLIDAMLEELEAIVELRENKAGAILRENKADAAVLSAHKALEEALININSDNKKSAK